MPVQLAMYNIKWRKRCASVKRRGRGGGGCKRKMLIGRQCGMCRLVTFYGLTDRIKNNEGKRGVYIYMHIWIYRVSERKRKKKERKKERERERERDRERERERD